MNRERRKEMEGNRFGIIIKDSDAKDKINLRRMKGNEMARW